MFKACSGSSSSLGDAFAELLELLSVPGAFRSNFHAVVRMGHCSESQLLKVLATYAVLSCMDTAPCLLGRVDTP